MQVINRIEEHKLSAKFLDLLDKYLLPDKTHHRVIKQFINILETFIRQDNRPYNDDSSILDNLQKMRTCITQVMDSTEKKSEMISIFENLIQSQDGHYLKSFLKEYYF